MEEILRGREDVGASACPTALVITDTDATPDALRALYDQLRHPHPSGDAIVRACATNPFRRIGLSAILCSLLGVCGTGAPSRRPPFLAVGLAASLAVFAFVGTASAAQIHVPLGQFGGVGGPTFSELRGLAVDQSSGDVYALDLGSEAVLKFDSTGAPVDFGSTGTNEIASGGFPGTGGGEAEIAVDSSSGEAAGDIYIANNQSLLIYGPEGSLRGELGGAEPCGVAVDSAGDVYVGRFPETVDKYTPAPGEDAPTDADRSPTPLTTPIELCNVGAQGDGSNVYAAHYLGGLHKYPASQFGEPEAVGTELDPTANTLAVDPGSAHVFADEGGQVAEFDGAGNRVVTFGSGELSESAAVAVDAASGNVYVADGETIKVFGPLVTRPDATTEEASDSRTEGVTFNGTVNPAGFQLEDCVFEYRPVGEADLGSEVPCTPTASEISPDSSMHAVTAAVTGLRANTAYRFRLTVTAVGIVTRGKELEFSTVGPPRITEILARDADQNSATLEATIDPRGATGPTLYRVETGPTTSYGNVVAVSTIAPGKGPTAISAHIDDLKAATTYHYRVVAKSAEGGETASADQQVETLNSCGFTDRRCLELVSRADKGPLAAPGKNVLVDPQIQFQAAAQGSAFAFTVESGYPETTAGIASALYLSRRGSAGWTFEQLTPPTLVAPPNAGGRSSNSRFNVLSSDLSCGVVSSAAPLVAGAPTGIVEAGGANLYRRDNADGSYQLITHLPPAGPPFPAKILVSEYQVVGMSRDCERVVFRTIYRYPGVAALSADSQLYEWEHGTLRNVAIIPGPGGIAEPVPAESLPGALDAEGGAIGHSRPTDYWRAVSTDASRIVFTAVSQFGADSGMRAIYLRDTTAPEVSAGTVPAIDISQSETATPNNGNSRYWTASTDGTRIFFTARYGLAANGSSFGATICSNAPSEGPGQQGGEGCDLYEYDAVAPAGARLTDLSPDVEDAEGAGVVGVLDASADGSYVYFAARGRLSSAGKTEQENLNSATYNIYLAHAGSVRFVRSLGEAEALRGHALVASRVNNTLWTSRSTLDGSDFAFESSAGVSAGIPMVYLYSGADATTVCVSCRHDGRPAFSGPLRSLLISAPETDLENQIVQPIVLAETGRLYFYSFDPLAPGAIEGARNLYQWQRGQVSLIATEPAGVPRSEGFPIASFFAGANADGADVYFATPQRLTPAAPAGWNVYDARVDGGLPEPAPPASPCDATGEGACNSGGANPSAGLPPTTSTFTGPSNPSAKKHKPKHHKKKHKPKHHKKKHKPGKKKHKKSGKAGRASGNRRAGK